MKHMSLDEIVYICQLLTEHDAGTPSRINYLCAHVLPGVDLDDAPYRKPNPDWERYLRSYGIRESEQRWVTKGIIEFARNGDLHFGYQTERMAHICWSLKHIGNALDLNEKPAESDAQSDTH